MTKVEPDQVEQVVWDLSPGEAGHFTAFMAQARLGQLRAKELEDRAGLIERDVQNLVGQINELRKTAEAERAAVAAGETGLRAVLASARQLDPGRLLKVARRKDGKVVAIVAPADPVPVGGGECGASTPAEARKNLSEGSSAPTGIQQAQEVPA